MSDSGLSAFASVLPVGGVVRFGRFGPEAVHAVYRPAANRTYPTNSWLAFPLVWGPVRMEAGDFARSVEQGDCAVPVFEHTDGALGEVMPVPIGRDLQATSLVADGVVQPGDTLLLDAQDVVEFAHERNEGRAFLRGGHGEEGVVLLDIDVRQPAIRPLDRRDPVHSQQRRQALLQRVPEPLYPPPRLRAVGGDVRDVQLLQRPPHLRQKRLVDLRARLRREEVVAAPVGVERREQTMSADRLRQPAKARGRALLLT